ncbi:MAG: DJ-1/PfpI family protein [Verrucomicrobia bacterium]|nr:DJ-1/PfpI family protein [Verrucomicrobiota bacterium]
MNIGFLLFPRLTQLDLTGPCEVLARAPGARIHTIWKSLDPVPSDRGLKLVPTTTMAECPQLDILCVPGGPGQVDLMEDDETLDFLRRQAAQAKWVTSVCTGSLLLGAAGLLKGYQATCHWASRDQLALFGAEAVEMRVVTDRNRVTGAGVTAGIDFALQLVANAFDEHTAHAIQLALEYEPTPPFWSGTPQHASAEILEEARQKMAVFMAKRLAASERAAARLKDEPKAEPSAPAEPWLD